jgi:hypothetical protein
MHDMGGRESQALHVDCTGEVNLETKLDQWGNFYNSHSPPGAFKAKAPYEALHERI